MTWFGRGFGRGPFGRKVKLTPLEFLVLTAFHNNPPKYGREIMEELSIKFEKIWIPTPGTIYPILSRLKQGGLIKTDSKDNYRKKYTITPKGTKAIREMTEGFEKEVRFFNKFFEFVEPSLRQFPPIPSMHPVPPIPPVLKRLRRMRKKFDSFMLQKYKKWLEEELLEINKIIKNPNES